MMQNMTKEELREMRIQVCMAWISAQERTTKPTIWKYQFPKSHVHLWSGTYVGASHFIEAMDRLGVKYEGDKFYPSIYLSGNVVFPDYSRLEGLGIQPYEVSDRPVQVNGKFYPYRVVEAAPELVKYTDIHARIAEEIEKRDASRAHLPVLRFGWEKML